MLPVAFKVSCLAHLLLLAGCTMHVAAKAMPAPELTLARATVAAITNVFPAYQADPISRYERPEILNVQRDLESLEDETDDSLFLKEEELLNKDWDILVALDNILQQEGMI